MDDVKISLHVVVGLEMSKRLCEKKKNLFWVEVFLWSLKEVLI